MRGASGTGKPATIAIPGQSTFTHTGQLLAFIVDPIQKRLRGTFNLSLLTFSLNIQPFHNMKTQNQIDWAAYHAARTIDLSPMMGEDAFNYSASAYEMGENAGRITWNNAKDGPQLLRDDAQREAFKEWIADFGAWNEGEREAFTDQELNALLVQFVSGDIREAGADSLEEIDPAQLQVDQEEGRVPSYLFQDDSGAWFYSIAR